VLHLEDDLVVAGAGAGHGWFVGRGSRSIRAVVWWEWVGGWAGTLLGWAWATLMLGSWIWIPALEKQLDLNSLIPWLFVE
jgi:hypothetical protein